VSTTVFQHNCEKHTKHVIMPINEQKSAFRNKFCFVWWLSILPDHEISGILIHLFWYNTFHRRLPLLYF